MKRTYLDSSVLIQAVQGVDGDKTAALLEDPEREFVAATFLKLELLPQPTFHKRKAELEFLAAYFERVAEWREADEHLVAAALKCEEFITAEKPGKPLHKARGLKVSFLPTV